MTVTLHLSDAEAKTLSMELESICAADGWPDVDGVDPGRVRDKIQAQLHAPDE